MNSETRKRLESLQNHAQQSIEGFGESIDSLDYENPTRSYYQGWKSCHEFWLEVILDLLERDSQEIEEEQINREQIRERGQ